MAKDQFGHGSNGNGGGIKRFFVGQAQQFGSFRGSGEYPGRGSSSDQAAANALMSSVKSGGVPVHDSMAGYGSNPTTAPAPENRQPGVGVSKGAQGFGPIKGNRTGGQEANKNLVSNMRAFGTVR